MSRLEILRHGEHINPFYTPIAGLKQSWAGRSTAEERPDGQVSGIVKRFKKHEQASALPISLGWIRATRAQALEYTLRSQTLRGLSFFSSLMGSLFCLYGATRSANLLNARWDDYLFAGIFAFASLCFLLYGIRLELFTPSDEPTLFDRARRKVYRTFREHQPGLRGLFKPWPMRVCEYEWDLIDVEHNATVSTTGSTLMRSHALMFIVRRSASDPTIIDAFNIGHTYELGETTVPAVWEHIRRFMEEGGPHLPTGEELAASEPPTTFWQCLCLVAPLGPKYVSFWKDHLPFMLLVHLLFPLFAPLFLVWAAVNWLSFKTATQVEWPDEILKEVGPAVDPRVLPTEAQALTPEARPGLSREYAPAAPKPPAAHAATKTDAREPLSFTRIQHPGGTLELRLDHILARGAEYVVADSAQAIHRGRLDATGRATLLDVPTGWLTIAFFD